MNLKIYNQTLNCADFLSAFTNAGPNTLGLINQFVFEQDCAIRSMVLSASVTNDSTTDIAGCAAIIGGGTLIGFDTTGKIPDMLMSAIINPNTTGNPAAAYNRTVAIAFNMDELLEMKSGTRLGLYGIGDTGIATSYLTATLTFYYYIMQP